MTTMRAILTTALVLLMVTVAHATPITYTFAYTAGTSTGTLGEPVVPSFDFSFTMPDYVTTTGLFDLPEPVTFFAGVDPLYQTLTQGGWNRHGWWIFGTNGSAGISENWAGCSYVRGACVMVLPYQGDVIAWGATLWHWDPLTVARIDGTVAITTAIGDVLPPDFVPPPPAPNPERRAIPESGSTLLLLGIVGAVGVLSALTGRVLEWLSAGTEEDRHA